MPNSTTGASPKRHFYTDPLAAAWMAKHLGMEFHTGGGDFCKMIPHVDPSKYEEQHFGLNADHWYVYPGSLHLLEPKVGDLIRGSNNKVAMYFMGETLPKTTAQIVQRDGKPFFWPEREAA